MSIFVFVWFFVGMCAGRELSIEELHRLPRLFHLDDYERCLSQRDGVYCVGTFELVPKTSPNPAYDIIKEQLKQHFSFDRRLLHRGYCLTKRCPEEQNTTRRFEQCADRFLRNHSLSARLNKLSYCTTHDERKAKLSMSPDLPQMAFLYVVYFILFLNFLGTVHDLYSDGKKNKHLMAWSIPVNWRALTTVEDSASLFAPVQSSKIIMHCLIIYTHANLLHFMGYMHNPEAVEKSRDSFVNVIIRNGTSLVQVFILISNFFTGYNVLETAKKGPISAGLTVKWILKRIFRLAPVYLLLTAYSATWWPRAGDGPLWSPLVEAESQVCRRKFWTHVLFVNNFVEPSELCMVQSWGIAAEVQLFLVSLLLTLLLLKLRVRAVPVLAALFVASCLFNVALAYVAGLIPMVKIIVPETLRNEFRGSRSFFHLHTSPWSNLPACLFGLLIAHIYFEQKNKSKAKAEDNKEIESVQNEPKLDNGRLVHENGLLAKTHAIANGNGIIANTNGIITNGNGIITDTNGLIANGKGIITNGNGALANEKSITSNRNAIDENSTYVKSNSALVNGNSIMPNKNGTVSKVNDILQVNGNGILTNGNGTLANKNGVLANVNGVLANGNGVLANGNGVLANGNGVLANGNGVLANGNSILANGNGVLANGNGKLANGNGLVANKNGIRAIVNGVSVNGNNMHDKENDVHNDKTFVNRNNIVNVVKNSAHDEDNGLSSDKLYERKNENGRLINGKDININDYGTHVNGFGTHENGLRYRKHIENDAKINGFKSLDNVAEKKSNGVGNGAVNQNGQCKSDGYENQNGSISKSKDRRKSNQAPFFLRYAHCFTIPLLISWLLGGSRVTAVEAPLAIAIYVGFERLMFSVTFAYQLLQIVTVRGPMGKLFSWRGWTVPARLVLSVAMVHWCVNATMLASRPQPVASSIFYVSLDFLATLFYSYVIAFPLHVLLELPMKRAIDALLS